MRNALPITIYIIIASISIALIVDGLIDALRPVITPYVMIGIGLIIFSLFAIYLTQKLKYRYIIILVFGITLIIIGLSIN